MKIKILHKVFSITLAFLVLFSTASITVEKHFCAGNLVSVSIFSEAKNCCPDTKKTENNSEETTKSLCCKDEIEVVQGQDQLRVHKNDLNNFQKDFVAAFVVSYHNLFTSLPQQTIPFKDYSPPNLVYDIQLLDQVFLI